MSDLHFITVSSSDPTALGAQVFDFSNDLASPINLDPLSKWQVALFQLDFATNANYGVQTMFVYSSIARESIVGSQNANVIGRILVRNAGAREIYKPAEPLEWQTLASRNFNKISVKCADATGVTVPGIGASTHVTFGFRREPTY